MKKKSIQKIKELYFGDSESYILVVTKDKLVINKRGKLCILNYKLEQVNCIELFENLAIYSIFKNKLNNELLLYSAENKCFIYVNLNTFMHKIIPLDNEFEDIFFSPLYIWHDDLILTDNKKNFYQVSIEDAQVDKITPVIVKEKYLLFFNIWEEYNELPITTYDPENYVVLLNDYDAQKVEIINFIENKKEVISYPLKRTHDFDFIYKNEFLLLVHEKQIELITPDKERLQIASEIPWIFLRAKFLYSEDCCFIALQGNNTFQEKDRLLVYCLKSLENIPTLK